MTNIEDTPNPLSKITELVRAVDKSDEMSPELQESGEELYDSIRPILRKFQKSAIEMRECLSVSFQKIDRSRDTWNAKARICEISTEQLWHEIGQITGCIQKVKLLKSRFQIESTDKIAEK
ncbi:MAG: hypothetical protein J7642_22875 [Cyanobacteria bacterium SBC]|nr:hypothetical protein [Cyanobacteria bacterium SBC]